MIGYKAFKQDLTCRGFQYQVGVTYNMPPEEIELCKAGFHFCQYPTDVLAYYDNDNDVYGKIKATGKIITNDDKSVTNEITIMELITKDQLFQLMPNQIERPNGDKEWYLGGKRHRLDGPARERNNGTKVWYSNGLVHRLDGPAVEYADGAKWWYLDGKLHRENGPAKEVANGDREWHQNGELHRLDGPAVEHANGDKEWWRHGNFHREDGSVSAC